MQLIKQVMNISKIHLIKNNLQDILMRRRRFRCWLHQMGFSTLYIMIYHAPELMDALSIQVSFISIHLTPSTLVYRFQLTSSTVTFHCLTMGSVFVSANFKKNPLTWLNISTGSSHFQPLNCHIWPLTNTATTRCQSASDSFSTASTTWKLSFVCTLEWAC